MSTPTPFILSSISTAETTKETQDKDRENKQRHSKGDLVKQLKFLVRINLTHTVNGNPTIISHYIASWFYFLFQRSQAIW